MSSFEEPFDNGAGDSELFDRAELDRMVDGELSEIQQQFLLKRLGDSPTGWKTLALAYVESAAFRTHFATRSAETSRGKVASLSDLDVRNARTACGVIDGAGSDCRPGSRRASTATSALASVAVLAVFGLGVWLGRTQVEWPERPSHIAEDTGSSSPGKLDATVHDDPTASAEASAMDDDLPVPETVQVVFSDGQSDVLRVMDVPIVGAKEASQQLNDFLNRKGSAIPVGLRTALEDSGHQIHESRKFWPAQLPDGRAVVIPVSQVHVANNPLLSP